MIHFVCDLTTTLSSSIGWSDAMQSFDWNDHWIVLAQQFKQTDLAGDVSKSWNHFVRTGQVWAFLAGIMAGYLAKTFTSFG